MKKSFASHADSFRSGQTSPVDLLTASLQLIDERESELNAFAHLARETAMQEAKVSAARWRAGKALSPIDGIVVGIKDIIETADMPTGQGSPLWTGFQSQRDSASVQALRDAGAIILGKTTTTEFAATELLAKTVNPHDPRRTPGGSSSGSAAAVGAGILPLALGSQVVGSTIRPASYCGCVGFKPTTGALNRSGSYDHLSQSCVGVLANSIEDAWLASKAIATRVGGDPGHAGLEGPDALPEATAPRRMLLLETNGWKRATPGAKTALAAAVNRMRAQGVEIVARSADAKLEAFEHAIEDALDLTWQIVGWEFRWPLGDYARRRADAVSKAMLGRYRDSLAMTQADYAAALAKRADIRAAYRDLLGDMCDGVITLGATGAAPVGFETTGHPGFNVPASLLGVPAMTLPLLTDEDMPLGLQIMGGHGHDADLFGIARWLIDNR